MINYIFINVDNADINKNIFTNVEDADKILIVNIDSGKQNGFRPNELFLAVNSYKFDTDVKTDVPYLQLKVMDKEIFYIHIDAKVFRVEESFSIFQHMFPDSKNPVYMGLTTEFIYKDKIKKLLSYYEKHPDIFGGSYSDFHIDFDGVKVLRVPPKDNIISGILLRSGINIATAVKEYAIFHHPEPLHSINIVDYNG